MVLDRKASAIKLSMLKIRRVLAGFLGLWVTIMCAVQVQADEVKTLNDINQITSSKTIKKVIESKPNEDAKPSGDLSLSVLNADYSKGVESSRNSTVIQPSLTINYKGLSANILGNIDTGPYETPADRTKKNTWTGTDINLSYGKTFGMVNIGVGYSYSFENPPFEGANRPDDQQEVNATLGLNVLFNPILTVYKLFDGGRRWYFQMGISHSFEFNTVASLKLAATAAYMIGGDATSATEARYDAHANQTTGKYNAFLDGVLTACLPIKVTSDVTITPTASYAFPLGTDAKNYMKGNGLEEVTNNVDRASSFLFGGLILSFRF